MPVPRLPRLAPLVVPAAFVGVWIALLAVRGPSWLGSNSDPEFVYLLDGLNVASGRRAFFGGHPGTPITILVALALRALHAAMSTSELTATVLARPEACLMPARLLLCAAGAASLVWVGRATLRATGSVAATVVAQSSPFLCGAILRTGLQVRPEPLLFALAGCLVALALDGRERPAAMGVVSGALVATKITALPLLAIPALLVRTQRGTNRFAVSFALSAALLTLPAWRALDQVVAMSIGIGTHAGAYGRGEPALFPAALWLEGAWFMVRAEPLLAVALATIVAALLVMSRRLEGWQRSPLATAFALAMCGSIAVAARHPVGTSYLVPALGLIGPSLALAIPALRSFVRPAFVAASIAIGAAAAGIGLWRTWHELRALRDSQLAAARFVEENYPSASRLYSYGASSPAYALYFGDEYAGGQFAREIQALYPHTGCFDPFAARYCFYPRFQPEGARTVVQGWPLGSAAAAALSTGRSVSAVFANGTEAVYELE